MTPSLIIFDCDGVIVDSELLTNRLLRDDLAAHGLDLPVEKVMQAFIGSTMTNISEKARGMGATLPADWVNSFYARLYARLAEGTDLIAGVETVLDHLHGMDIPFCVASNGRMAKMEITLGQRPALYARLAGRLFSAEHVALPKPAPDLFLHAARIMGHPPESCIVIEDSATGARAAHAAGMPCLGYAPESDGAHLRAEGAEVFHNMADLPARLGL